MVFISGDSGDSGVPAPPLPAYRLADVDRLRRKLLGAEVLLEFIGAPLSADEFCAFTAAWLSCLPSGVVADAVRDSLLPLATQPITESVLRQLAWRFSGNVSRLRSGLPVPPWVSQKVDEWAPLEIVEVSPRRNKKDQVGADFRCRFLAGSPAGMLTSAFFSLAFCRWVSPQIGFTHASKEYPFVAPHQWARLRLYGLVQRARSLTKPVFSRVAATKPLQAYNRRLIHYRARTGFTCPKSFKHACHVCPLGSADCPVACRPLTLTPGYCAVCRKLDALFDPRFCYTETCVACYYRQQLHRHKGG